MEYSSSRLSQSDPQRSQRSWCPDPDAAVTRSEFLRRRFEIREGGSCPRPAGFPRMKSPSTGDPASEVYNKDRLDPMTGPSRSPRQRTAATWHGLPAAAKTPDSAGPPALSPIGRDLAGRRRAICVLFVSRYSIQNVRGPTTAQEPRPLAEPVFSKDSRLEFYDIINAASVSFSFIRCFQEPWLPLPLHWSRVPCYRLCCRSIFFESNWRCWLE